MSKKKYRDITVDGIKYAWIILRNYEEETVLKIYENKQEIHFVVYGFRESVTPKMVATAIREFKNDLQVPCWIPKHECKVKECESICRRKKDGDTRENITPRTMHQNQLDD